MNLRAHIFSIFSVALQLFGAETGKLLYSTLLESRALLCICALPQDDRYIFAGTDNGILHSVWLRDPMVCSYLSIWNINLYCFFFFRLLEPCLLWSFISEMLYWFRVCSLPLTFFCHSLCYSPIYRFTHASRTPRKWLVNHSGDEQSVQSRSILNIAVFWIDLEICSFKLKHTCYICIYTYHGKRKVKRMDLALKM